MMAQKLWGPTGSIGNNGGSSNGGSSNDGCNQQQQQAGTVHAIDIDAAAVQQATQNASASPWANLISVSHSSLQDWTRQCNIHYDVIITNPPYFVRSSKPVQSSRAAARHADDCLPFKDLAVCSAQLLAPGGRLCVVLPVQEALLFCREAAAAGLQLTRLTQVGICVCVFVFLWVTTCGVHVRIYVVLQVVAVRMPLQYNILLYCKHDVLTRMVHRTAVGSWVHCARGASKPWPCGFGS